MRVSRCRHEVAHASKKDQRCSRTWHSIMIQDCHHRRRGGTIARFDVGCFTALDRQLDAKHITRARATPGSVLTLKTRLKHDERSGSWQLVGAWGSSTRSCPGPSAPTWQVGKLSSHAMVSPWNWCLATRAANVNKQQGRIVTQIVPYTSPASGGGRKGN